MCTARVTIWRGRVNIIQLSLPFPLKLSSSPLRRGWLEAFLLWPDPLDPFTTGGTPLSVRDPFTASSTLVTPEVDRVSKSSCRTTKRPQLDCNRTEKDRTAVASCLASATDQLQVVSFHEKLKNWSTTGCMSECSTRLCDSNSGPIV
jgi:hypothetical protein